jgi:hypothetical protein
MAVHTENALRRPGIAQVLYSVLAVAAFETVGAKSLVTCENRQVFDLAPARTATISAIVADQRAIS